MKICQHSHNRLIDNIGDYLYFKNQRMGASNLKLIHISSTWDCTALHNFLPIFQKKKKDFQKLAGLLLADEVVNHVGIYGSKAAEGLSAFQRRSCSLSRQYAVNEIRSTSNNEASVWTCSCISGLLINAMSMEASRDHRRFRLLSTDRHRANRLGRLRLMIHIMVHRIMHRCHVVGSYWLIYPKLSGLF